MTHTIHTYTKHTQTHTVDPNDPDHILLKRSGRLVTLIDIYVNRTYGQGYDNNNKTVPKHQPTHTHSLTNINKRGAHTHKYTLTHIPSLCLTQLTRTTLTKSC